MKTLVVYYSFEGNTALMAKTIAQTAQADTLSLKPVDEIKTKGFMKYFWGGRQAMMKTKPALRPFDKNPQDYDLIFIGTPVWAFHYAPPLATFFEQVPLKNKKIALFCCHGGGKGPVFNKMSSELADNKILGQIDFKEPLSTNRVQNVERARLWAQEIISR